MTFWIVLSAAGVVLWLAALVGVVALCLAAEELPDADADERASSVALYPTSDRGVHGTVVDYMRAGLSADRAVTRAYEDQQA